MEIKAEQLEKDIDAIPGVCEDGKKAIKKLFENNFPVKFSKRSFFKDQAVYRHNGTGPSGEENKGGIYFCVRTYSNRGVYAIRHLGNDTHFGGDQNLDKLNNDLRYFELISDSLEEYFRKKFDGRL